MAIYQLPCICKNTEETHNNNGQVEVRLVLEVKNDGVLFSTPDETNAQLKLPASKIVTIKLDPMLRMSFKGAPWGNLLLKIENSLDHPARILPENCMAIGWK